MPTDSPSGQKNADDRCKVGNGELAKIGRYNVTNALDIIGNKIPHWARLVTSDGNGFLYHFQSLSGLNTFVLWNDVFF